MRTGSSTLRESGTIARTPIPAAAKQPFVEIHCDGACSPNPGDGGWGVVMISWAHDGSRRELAGAEPDTTNNHMELLAAIKALQALKRPCRVRLSTNSEYVQRAFTKDRLAFWQPTVGKRGGVTRSPTSICGASSCA